MQIGSEGRWWNRKVPIGRIGLTLAVVLAAPWILPYVTMPAKTLTWGLTHDWTATYQNQSLKLPFMWRQEETPAGTHSIALRRPSRQLTYLGFESIDIIDDRAKPFDSQAAIQRWKGFEPCLRQPEDWTEQLSGDAFVHEHYSCLATHRKRFSSLHVVCFSNDGMWSVTLLGTPKSIDDLQKIFHNLCSLSGQTSKL